MQGTLQCGSKSLGYNIEDQWVGISGYRKKSKITKKVFDEMSLKRFVV